MKLDLSDLSLPLSVRPAMALTDQELLRFSLDNKPYRIEATSTGELTIMNPLGGLGGTHESYVIRMLGIWTEEDGQGIDFSSNTGFRLPDGSCLSPDASWVSLVRWNALTPQQQKSYPPLCPEFVIEVRSQSDPRKLVEAKMALWIENGAQLAWLIDPVDGNVVIYKPGEPTETLERPDVVQGHGPVAGFALRTTRLWSAQEI